MRLLALPGVFRPHSDSWLLARAVEREPLTEGARVLDLCSGSGVLAIAAALAGASEVTAVDVSRRSLLAIRANARLNRVEVNALRGDLFQPVRARRFGLILANPPYVPSAAEELPHRGLARAWEAGDTGRSFIERICEEAPEHLAPGGVVLLVHSSICGEAETVEALERRGLQTSVVERRSGELGPLMHSRRHMLADRGLLAGPSEELLVIRARAPEPARVAA